MSLTKLIGKNVRWLRKQKHLAQLTLAYESNVSICCLRRIESGSKKMLLTKVQKIADALEVPLQQLFLPRKINTNVSEYRCNVFIQNIKMCEKLFLTKFGKNLRKDLDRWIDSIIKENIIENNKQ